MTSTPDIRWYNRLAAWLWERVNEPLMDLALPVWQAEAYADLEDEWEEDRAREEERDDA
jgi:hypothetical protein